MASIEYQVRLWTSDLSRWRVLPLKSGPRARTGVESASWRILRVGGYADAELILLGATPTGLTHDRRIEFFARDRDDRRTGAAWNPWVRLYRGYVREFDIERATEDDPRRVRVGLYGIFERLGRSLVRQRYQFTPEKDAAEVFAQIAERWKGAQYSAVVVRDDTVTGQTMPSYDARGSGVGRSLADVAEALVGFVGGQAWVGGDVDPTGDENGAGADRVGLAPFGNPATPAFTLNIPDRRERIGARDLHETSLGAVTVLHLVGGREPHGGNLLAPAVQGNTGFETPLAPGDQAVNMVPNPGFELATGGANNWDGNGTIKGEGDPEQPAFEGVKRAEIDNADANPEYFEIDFTPHYRFYLDHLYTLDFMACLETDSSDAELTASLTLLDSDGDPLAGAPHASLVLPPTDLAAEWQRFTIPDIAIVPGADQVRIRLEMSGGTGGNGEGILLDLVRFFDQTAPVQAGWQERANGDARWWRIDRVVEDVVFEGGSSMYYDSGVEVADDDALDLVFEPLGQQRAPVIGGTTVVFKIAFKLADGSPNHKTILEIEEWKDGAFHKSHRQVFNETATDWRRHFITATMDQETDEFLVRYRIRQEGKAYLDAFQVTTYTARDLFETADTFIEGQTFTTILRAADLYAPGGPYPDADLYAAALALGEIPAEVTVEAVTSRAQAEVYGDAYFRPRLTPLLAPELELQGWPLALWPGQYLRAIGAEGQEIFPRPLPVLEVSGSWSGGILRLMPSINEERESEERTARQIAREEARKAIPGAVLGGGGFPNASLTPRG